MIIGLFNFLCFPGIGSKTDSIWEEKKILFGREKILEPHIVLTDVGSVNFETLQSNYKLDYTGISEPLPSNAQILTLEPWGKNTLLLRFENLTPSPNKMPEYPQSINLKSLFNDIIVTNVRETALGKSKLIN